MTLMGVKFRAYPTTVQKRVLNQWMGCGKFIYNAKCAEDRYFRAFRRGSLSLTGHPIPVDQTYSQFKSEATPWLKECPSQILRNSAVIWYEAYQKYFKRRAGKPVPKKKGSNSSIGLTSELFALEEGKAGKWTLFIGTQTKNIGFLSFHAHRSFKMPKSITLSRINGKYFVSFNYEDGLIPIDPWVRVHPLIQQGEAALLEMTQGHDRGVKIGVQSSSGESYGLTPQQRRRVERKKKGLKRQQRRLARQEKGSKRYQKTKQRMTQAHQKLGNIRTDYAHQTSRQIVDGAASILVWEDLPTKQMTKKAQPKQDEKGKFLPNRASAKSGLNEAILGSVWGLVLQYVGYKAKATGKLVIILDPRYSSQECAQCHHTHPDNRLSQSLFVCLGCGHIENADQNASEIMKYRGVRALLEIPSEQWEETHKGSGIWKICKIPAGTRGSARGGKGKTQDAKRLVQSQRSANRVVASG
ncbi:MAG: transposase [Candidatus Tectomicrobia bacterium]|nr:transposase [Candidatus Tectomicrobia bacterium]